MKKDIVAVGSIAFDSVKTPVGKKERILGGSLTHFINASSVIPSLSKGIVGVVGEDFSSKEESFFTSRNVDTTDLEKKQGKTFFWEGYYEKDMNQAFTLKTELNVFADFSPKISQANEKTKFLFLGNIDPVLQLSVLEKIEFETCFMDTMNFWLETKKEDVLKVLKKITGLIINETEAFLLTGESNYIKAAALIMDMGPSFVIIKRGSAGSTFFSKSGLFISYPAFPVANLVDPTGAGDSFAGGFVSYFTANKEKKTESVLIKEALAYATMIASFNVEGFGIDGLADKKENDVLSRMEKYYEFSLLPNFK
ncbi:MAG: hypothetical protein A2Y41_08015 [Spirochaetes bacterium GWB1_36_13]|nr:MAG: hypothetical protein A2Y41_08015 [Spirochaetes bacterium GWB1_36_13]